ncbi:MULTISPECIES: entericidin A/B family lipoprotein [Halomonadaceae]|jgi:predicted small secreted protein|uniref:Entericidin A/B family lipoprotein n=2 Tax=Billgrantia TaxID=3137761 RepID=A0AAW4YVI5_9GAMM|nr:MULTISPECIES: entericidin A/B family lipoprotein [Halomonas]MCE8013663.1 entericidin A/B family lipoprotein [Halomonas desiderata]MCE8026317.1 entericidin A/B family lipoprotein [Halomonas aerodenitrificans]MCE8031170.1 entericidin A/B family lipoprotein [Halomonas desiderata]MCE8039688.1 entericidin A/B family lipoprotein [Halomonas sp. MCCC 1A11062]MCE8044016.1 entericidin A/B family lipoprotein [Halomonas desiderata]
MKRTVATMLALLLGLSLLSGCNTMRGMGEDIEAGGEAIQRQSNSY